jgi:hypothetical protein
MWIFQIKCCNKKIPLFFTTTNEVLNIVVGHKTFFFGMVFLIIIKFL